MARPGTTTPRAVESSLDGLPLRDALRRSRAELDETQAIARLGSWEIQVEPRTVTWSRQLFELLDVDPETFVPGPEAFIGRFVPEDRVRVQAEWAALATEPGERMIDGRVVLRDGSVRWVRTLGWALEHDEHGTPTRYGGTVQDIDALKRTERQLREAVELNRMMQVLAGAANEASTLDEAMVRLRDLLLADEDWLRGVTFTVAGERLEWRRLPGDDGRPPTARERDVAAAALASDSGFALEDDVVPDRFVVGFPVRIDGEAAVVVVITAASWLAHRSSLEPLVAQVADQLAQVAAREALVGELTRSRSQLAEAQSIARLGSWEIQLEPWEVTWSEQMYELLGAERSTVEPGLDAFIEHIVDEDRPAIAGEWGRLAVEPGERTVDARVRNPDGSVRWVRTLGRVLGCDADGTPVRFGGTVQDIDVLKRTELQMVDAVDLNTIMQLIASAANEASSLDDALSRIQALMLAHPDWERGVAFDVTEVGLQHRPVTPHEDLRPTALECAVAERARVAGEVVFEEDARPEKPLLALPVRVDGQVQIVVVVTNVSPFERHEMVRSLAAQAAVQLEQVAVREAAARELAAARDLALAASTAKSDFLATMSHEIRTPLNGVIGLNDLLLRTGLDPQQRQFAEAMQNAGRSLLVLISDILDFSKIEAGGLELEAVAFQPAVVVQGTIELFAPIAQAKGVDLDVEVDADVPERVEGDPSRFGQVLSNLVANAVKFTHEGGVHVRVSALTEGDDVTLRVAVRDTGIGMDDEQLERIFQPFRQADASTTRTFGGTGLGLAIAQRLADALGGRIGVASLLGEGSTFWFTGRFRVPSTSSRREATATAPGDARRGGHVLVVEDNEVNQLVAVGMLEVLGYTSEVAGDGAAAAARAAGGRFDAVLMDLQMPRLDGYAATRLIRNAEPPGVRMPIIALTASATAGEQERCLAAGMTGFLSKPVGVEALGRVLAEQLAGVPLVAEPVARLHAVEPAVEDDLPLPVLDLDRLDDLVEMGAAAVPLVQRAVDNFVAAVDDNLDDLREALASADAPAVRAAAHRVKGSAANLGAQRAAAAALALEDLADTGRLDGAPELLGALAEALTEAAAALAAHELVPGPAEDAYSA